MPILLPTGLFDDELLYSALARSQDMMGYHARRDMLDAAFGATTITASIDLPSRLDEAGSRLLCMAGMEDAGARLLHRHTIYPYYARVVEEGAARRAAELMRGAGGGIVHGLLGVRSSRVPAPARLRYCRDCVAADRRAEGAAWWRRAHQLPGVLVCPTHLCPLLDSTIRTSCARERLAFRSLERSIDADDRPCAAYSLLDDRADSLSAIAMISASWLVSGEAASCVSGVGIGELWERRRHALEDAGFARGARQVDTQRLRDTVVEAFGQRLLREIGCLPGGPGSDDWVARMARPPRRSAHPLYHVLLAVALAGSPASAAPAAREPSCPSAAWWASPRDARDDDRFRRLVADPAYSLRAIARELGIDPLTVQRRARRLGVWRDRWKLRACVEPATAAREKEKSNLISARRRWLRCCRRHAKCSRTAIRRIVPTAFALLYRRDRDWLAAHSPARIRPVRRRSGVDWPERDVVVAAALAETAARMGTAGARERAVRPATLGRAMDRLALVQQHRDRLPMTATLVARLSECPRSLAAARLQRAVADMIADGRPPPALSVLARAAGLNSKRADELHAEMVAGLARIADAAP